MASCNSSPPSPTEKEQELDLSESLVSNESSQQQRKRKVLTNIDSEIKKLKLNYGKTLISSYSIISLVEHG